MDRKIFDNKKRIIILCEGDTEESAVNYFIKPQWQKDGFREIGLKAVNLNGRLEKMFSILPKFAFNEKYKAIFTLIDLYGSNRVMFDKFDDLDIKISKMKKWIEDKFDNYVLKRLHPHLAVHETEAWFLANEEILTEILHVKIQKFHNPETINFEEHPSKRINKLFQKNLKRGYRKGGINGDDRKILEKMSLKETLKTCPNLRLLYDDLKNIGNQML
jgi:uncharacterized protein YeeX (DUF496 family)